MYQTQTVSKHSKFFDYQVPKPWYFPSISVRERERAVAKKKEIENRSPCWGEEEKDDKNKQTHKQEKLWETKLKLVQANQLNQFHKTYNIESRFFYFIVIIVKVYIDSTIGSAANTKREKNKLPKANMKADEGIKWKQIISVPLFLWDQCQ